jgi:hypothetical protein
MCRVVLGMYAGCAERVGCVVRGGGEERKPVGSRVAWMARAVVHTGYVLAGLSRRFIYNCAVCTRCFLQRKERASKGSGVKAVQRGNKSRRH